MNQEINKWWLKFPPTLRHIYSSCYTLVGILWMQSHLANIILESIKKGSSAEILLRDYVALISPMQELFVNTEIRLSLVYDELAGVNNEIIKWQPSSKSQSLIYLSSSWHELILKVARDWLMLTTKEIYSAWNPDFVADYDTIDKAEWDNIPLEELAKYVNPNALKINSILYHFDKAPETKIFEQWKIRLNQEISRAYDRRLISGRSYSEDQDPSYSKIDDEYLSILENVINERPAYNRDHEWLKWHEKEGLGAAKIRDRWDCLSEKNRKSISPILWEKVGGDSRLEKNAGYEIVKTGLRQAKTDRKKNEQKI